MKDHHLDPLRLVTHQQHEHRLREAAAERLARGLRRTPQTRRRLLARINPGLTHATSSGERTLVKPVGAEDSAHQFARARRIYSEFHARARIPERTEFGKEWGDPRAS